MYKCLYCESVFPRLPEKGTCPNCGGPGLKEMKRPEPTQDEMAFIVPIVKNPVRRAKIWVFRTFGFKAVMTTMVILILILLASFVYWLMWRASAPSTTDPSYQLILPTAASTVTPIPNTNPWQNENWLTAQEARALRNQLNVVNLALLDNGGALYSANHSYRFTGKEPWQQAKPLSMTELTVSGTSATIKAAGYDYTLNVYQPFILASQPTKVIVVDAESHIWQADTQSLTITSLNDVISGLTTEIAPNSNLSFTY